MMEYCEYWGLDLKKNGYKLSLTVIEVEEIWGKRRNEFEDSITRDLAIAMKEENEKGK